MMCIKFIDVNIYVYVLDDVEFDVGFIWDIIVLMEMYLIYLRYIILRLLI